MNLIYINGIGYLPIELAMLQELGIDITGIISTSGYGLCVVGPEVPTETFEVTETSVYAEDLGSEVPIVGCAMGMSALLGSTVQQSIKHVILPESIKFLIYGFGGMT
jgi:hypothetical protein